MVGSLLLMEYMITMAAPIWERWLFYGGDRGNLNLLQTLEERLVTSGDLRQFLESILAAVCDRLQSHGAFIVVLGPRGLEMVVQVGEKPFPLESLPEDLVTDVVEKVNGKGLFAWGSYWIFPLFGRNKDSRNLLGLLGVVQKPGGVFDEEQREPFRLLAYRASIALEDRAAQEQVFNSLEALKPQVDMIQRLRAAARYDGTNVLTAPEPPLEEMDLVKWVKEALTHYWGGPKLTDSPLLRLRVVQRLLDGQDESQANAVRTVLRQAIEQVKPEGERRFTGEWILYNILEMKFMEGKKVREVARRLAMSDADLYRKQRVAIESVAKVILKMEQKAREEAVLGENGKQSTISTN